MMELTMDNVAKNSMMQDDRSSRGSSGGSPSVPVEKYRMLDITRDKPIKVCVRVAVPVRDHPKFNFVGKLLGPKGNSMKRLQEETMCKMAVLGRGSMRDRKKEEDLRLSGDPRYAHLAEDLHVEISTFAAPAEAHARIAYALAEVRRFLVPDYHDDIRQEQMWEMQALSTTNQNGDNNDLLSGANDPNDDQDSCSNHFANDCDMPATAGTPTVAAGPALNHHHSALAMDDSQCGTVKSTTNNSIHQQHTSHPHLQQQQQQQHQQQQQIHHQHHHIGNALPVDTETQTVTFLDAQNSLLHHPALRGVKTMNLGGSMARKRPLLGAPRTGMNPTKRTVMTLLARARTAQSLHGARGPIGEPIQVITSPLILQQPLDIMHQTNGNGINMTPTTTVATMQKENILQGA